VAEALALLRKAERDSLSGPRVRPLRRALEAQLELENAPDEAWRPRNLFLAGGIIGILLTMALLLWKKPGAGEGRGRGVTFSRSWGYRFVIFILILLVLGSFRGFSAPARSGNRGSYALVREAEALRAPAPGSSVSFTVRAGERIRVRAAAGDWIYAETGDGDAGRVGWLPVGQVVFY
jgi:hypothetical protein